MADDLLDKFAEYTDDDLFGVLGVHLYGSGLAVSPSDLHSYGRRAATWFANKARWLWKEVEDTSTYRSWRASAKQGQVADPVTISGILEEDWDSASAAALALLMVRSRCAEVTDAYDIAVSFAEEEREYVRRTVTAARALALKVFYEPDMTNAWWGRHYLFEKRKIYGQLALHFVPFISAGYFSRPSPRDDFAHAVVRAVERGDRYILPVLVGEVRVPEELLSPHIGVLHADLHTPEEVAAHMRLVVDASREEERRPRDIGAIIDRARGEVDEISNPP
ncbi:hypothetical protein [Lentzea sp. NEAU-D7]|uniref:hypothetical protein n=1 Tax=Lentzea sp. NEAU-D7 TaxID=2994667 RepID=UPI00224B2A30|nr:hypothetical protein [Lentzea sp. NEAU-D7]MCX2947047.1 hypothetical protein [Lentzea sp. NEAU-D7]